MQGRLIENCLVFMAMSAQVNVSVRISLLVFIPEISMLKMNPALAGLIKKVDEILKKSR